MTSTLLLTNTSQYTTLSCAECGMVFAVTEAFERSRRQDKKSFFCPMGHSQWFPGETPEQKMQKQIDAANRRAEMERSWRQEESSRRQRAERQRSAMQGVATRRTNELKKVKAGICPCCTKHLADLQRHMQRQHPHYEPDREQTMLEQQMNADAVAK